MRKYPNYEQGAPVTLPQWSDSFKFGTVFKGCQPVKIHVSDDPDVDKAHINDYYEHPQLPGLLLKKVSSVEELFRLGSSFVTAPIASSNSYRITGFIGAQAEAILLSGRMPNCSPEIDKGRENTESISVGDDTKGANRAIASLPYDSYMGAVPGHFSQGGSLSTSYELGGSSVSLTAEKATTYDQAVLAVITQATAGVIVAHRDRPESKCSGYLGYAVSQGTFGDILEKDAQRFANSFQKDIRDKALDAILKEASGANDRATIGIGVSFMKEGDNMVPRVGLLVPTVNPIGHGTGSIVNRFQSYSDFIGGAMTFAVEEVADSSLSVEACANIRDSILGVFALETAYGRPAPYIHVKQEGRKTIDQHLRERSEWVESEFSEERVKGVLDKEARVLYKGTPQEVRVPSLDTPVPYQHAAYGGLMSHPYGFALQGRLRDHYRRIYKRIERSV